MSLHAYCRYMAHFQSGWREAAASRSNTLSMLMIFAVLLIFFQAIYQIFPLQELGLPGLTPARFLWYLAVTESLICGHGLYAFGTMISDGKLTEMMRRPLNMAGMFLARKMGQHVFGTLLQLAFAAVVLPLFFQAKISLPWALLPVFFLSLLLSILIFEMMGYVIGMIEVRGPYSRPLCWIFSKLAFTFGGLFFPVTFFPPLVRQIAYLTPFPSMLSIPASWMLKPEAAFLLQGICIQIVWTVLMAGLVMVLEHRLIRYVLIKGD